MFVSKVAWHEIRDGILLPFAVRPPPPMKPKPGVPTGSKPTPVPRRSTASDSGETGM